MLAAKKLKAPSQKIGVTTVMSGAWVPPARYGSLHMKASPSAMSVRPYSRNVASTPPASEPRCIGMCAAWAMSRPRASNSATEQSLRSLMFGEKDART